MKNPNIDSDLIQAVEANDSNLVESLLNEIQPSDLNYRDKYGQTALHHAIKYPLIAKALLEKGADPTIRSKTSGSFSSERDGVDPIGMAIANGNPEIVKLIIQYLKSQELPSADSSMDHSLSPAVSSTALVPTNPFSSLTSADYYTGEEKYITIKEFTADSKKFRDSEALTYQSAYSELPSLKVEPRLNPKISTIEEPIGLSNNLHIVAERNINPELTRELIIQLHRTGNNINAKDSLGRTPLHRAIQMRNLEAVETLLALGANVNSEYYKSHEEKLIQQHVEKIVKKEQYQDTTIASFERQIFDELQDSQSKKPKIQSDSSDDGGLISKYGDTPFMMALKHCRAGRGDEKDDDLTPEEKMAKENDIRMISMILNNPNLNFNTPGDDLQTPLHVVAEKSMYEVMKVFLMSRKFEIDSQDDFKETALHFAAKKGNIKMVNLLLEHGASTTIKNYNGHTALDLLQEFHENKLKLIEQEKQALITSKQQLEKDGTSSKREETALITLSAQEEELSSQKTSMELMCFRPLRNSSNDLLATDPQSRLFNAVKTNNLTDVKRLLQPGVTANIKDANEITPLHMAVQNQNLEIVKLLLNARALTSATDKLGNTPLHYATRSNQIEIATALLNKQSAIYSSENKFGEMAFDIAVTNKNPEMLNLFMPHFIKSMKYRDHDSFSRFDTTTLASCEKILDDEGMKKVFLDFKDENGQSIVHIACANGLKDLVSLFERKGLDFEIQDNKGKTAKNLADERSPNPSGVARGASADKGGPRQK